MNILLLTGGGHIDFSEALITMINAHRERGNRILASESGWEGIGTRNSALVDITEHPTEYLKYLGGSFLGSARKNPDLEIVLENCRRYGIDVIKACGGEDTLGVADKAHKTKRIPIVGWPKTMDNDTNGSYATIGYTTAAYIAALNTFEAFRTSYTHARIVLVVFFGRTYDWVVGAAGDYGCADYVIPAERTDLSLKQIAGQIKNVYYGNKEKYGRPFAVVAVSEGAGVLVGLKPYLDAVMRGKPYKYDDFGHPKLRPDIVGLALEDALAEQMGIDSENISLKVVSYHLRDPNLLPLDDIFARKTAEECVRLVDRGEFGKVATIQDPEVSGFLPDDPSLHVDANGKKLYVGNISLEDAVRERPVKGTAFFDYDVLRATGGFSHYLLPLLGPKRVNPRDLIVPFKNAQPLLLQ